MMKPEIIVKLKTLQVRIHELPSDYSYEIKSPEYVRSIWNKELLTAAISIDIDGCVAEDLIFWNRISKHMKKYQKNYTINKVKNEIKELGLKVSATTRKLVVGPTVYFTLTMPDDELTQSKKY